MLQTGFLSYHLDVVGEGLQTEIRYTFTNRTGAAVYLVNCDGVFEMGLEWHTGGVWAHAWGPLVNDCVSPPMVIERDAAFTGTLLVSGGRPGTDIHPEFSTEDPDGNYRIVWNGVLSSFQDELPFGPEIPLEARTSNAFTLGVK